MNKIIPFDYHGNEVRSLMINNEPWFVAKDVCNVLELGDTSKSIARLDDDEKGTNSIPTLGGSQEMSIVSESGLYSLTLGSKKPEAKPFKRWITHDVLPTLRKTGAYSISGYAPKATSLGEVASFLKVMRSIMKENGQLPEKIAEMAELLCRQFNIKIPENFVKHNPFEQTSLFNITANIVLPSLSPGKTAKSGDSDAS
mgnify:CR=1 FL=1|jgi:prophage antirepressor-like protein